MEVNIERVNEWEKELKKKEDAPEPTKEDVSLRGSKRSMKSSNSGTIIQKSGSKVQESSTQSINNFPPVPPPKNSKHDESAVKAVSSKSSSSKKNDKY